MKTLLTKRFIAAFAGLLSLVGVQQAHALSCIPPNFGQTFNQLQDVPEAYWVAVGRFTHSQPVPQPVPPLQYGQPYDPNQPTPKAAWMWFEGKYVGENHMSERSGGWVYVQNTCLGPWCSNLPPTNQRMMAFFEATPYNYKKMKTNPCGGQYMDNPRRRHIRAIQRCFQNENCGPNELNVFGNGYNTF